VESAQEGCILCLFLHLQCEDDTTCTLYRNCPSWCSWSRVELRGLSGILGVTCLALDGQLHVSNVTNPFQISYSTLQLDIYMLDTTSMEFLHVNCSYPILKAFKCVPSNGQEIDLITSHRGLRVWRAVHQIIYATGNFHPSALQSLPRSSLCKPYAATQSPLPRPNMLVHNLAKTVAS
jgi:hypothetical protein